MKKLLVILVVTTVFCAAYAQPKGYIGASYVAAEYSEDDIPDIDLDGFRIFGGVPVNEYFAVEGMFLYVTGDEAVSNIDVDLDGYAFSLFGKGLLPVHEYIKFYGLLGATYGYLEAEASFGGFSADEDEDDFSLSYGVGVEIKIVDNLAAHADYIMYMNKSDYDVGGFAIGLTFQF